MAWMQAAEIGAGILSGILGGNAQAKAQKAQLREGRRQFDAQHALATRRQGMEEEVMARRKRGLARTGGLRDMILQRVFGQGIRPQESEPLPPRPMGGY